MATTNGMRKKSEPKPSAVPQFLTVQEVMDALRISKHVVYDMLADGQLESVKIRRSRRITRESFDQYLESCRG